MTKVEHKVETYLIWSRKSKQRSRKSKHRILSDNVETYLCGVKQTNFQIFKNGRSRKSRRSKHIEIWSRKLKHIYAGSNKQILKKMSAEKVETYRNLVEKVETYLSWVEQSRNIPKFGRDGRNIPIFGR